MWRVVLLLAATLLVASGLRCPTQRFLTDGGSSSSFPPLVSSATATSFHGAYPTEELFEFSYPTGSIYSWCTDETDTLPSITITLADPVVLYGLLSGGYYSSSVARYVSNFTMEYSETEGGDSSPYDPLGNLLIFSVPSIGSPVLLQSPLLVTTLHLHVLDYELVGSSTDRVCWTLALIGCLQSDAVEEESPSPEPAISSVMSVTPTKVSLSPGPTAAAEQPCSSVARSEEEDSLVVVITVPTALLTITAVAVLVAAGVAVCWKVYHRPSTEYSNHEQRERAATIKEVDNTLYHICDKPGQVYEDVQQPDSQELVDNPAYSSQRPSLATDEEMALLRSQNSEKSVQHEEYSYAVPPDLHVNVYEGALP